MHDDIHTADKIRNHMCSIKMGSTTELLTTFFKKYKFNSSLSCTNYSVTRHFEMPDELLDLWLVNYLSQICLFLLFFKTLLEYHK